MSPAVREAKGGGYLSRGKFFARVTIRPQKRKLVRLRWCTNLDDAAARALALQAMVNNLREAGESEHVAAVLKSGGPADADKLAAVARTVARIVEGKLTKRPEDGKPGGVETFETFGKKWTSGELHESYPDDVKEKKTSREDKYRLAILSKTIGPVPLARFTLQDAQAAMRALPVDLEVNTRRQYAQAMHRVLEMAVYPACILAHSPLPKGFVPKPGKQKAKSQPWPKEDATGLACETWPLCERMLFGFLAREGMRKGEAAALTWGDLDLTVGAINLDENKTDAPRAWALDPSVTTALRIWKGMRTDTKRTDLVFRQTDGEPYPKDGGVAEAYRLYLEKACNARPEILAKQPKGSNRLQVRGHDLRGLFITTALANGKTEAWVQDRTGHTTSGMLNRYRKVARTASELGLGTLVPMATAVPEIAAALEVENAAKIAAENAGAKRGCSTDEAPPGPPNMPINPQKTAGTADDLEFRFHRREA
jgi:integrase